MHSKDCRTRTTKRSLMLAFSFPWIANLVRRVTRNARAVVDETQDEDPGRIRPPTRTRAGSGILFSSKPHQCRMMTLLVDAVDLPNLTNRAVRRIARRFLPRPIASTEEQPGRGRPPP